ncbi:hypothetical protein Pcinc_013448 [Petrolisthes cinctipes]|uniref:Uncharacterized protein n=1 Tax=Petrolisthes cinctipes TaxID=88211 RepID=A0AAE1KSA5_PETCI|nr:hypothetical protein Pcinc_013448 [Petrolisthes cinctipes]
MPLSLPPHLSLHLTSPFLSPLGPFHFASPPRLLPFPPSYLSPPLPPIYLLLLLSPPHYPHASPPPQLTTHVPLLHLYPLHPTPTARTTTSLQQTPLASHSSSTLCSPGQ